MFRASKDRTMASQQWNDIKELTLTLAKEEKLDVGDFPGLLAGGAVGGARSSCVKGGFIPLFDVVLKLSPEMQEKLYRGVMKILPSVAWTGLDMLLERVIKDTKLKNTIVSFIKTFIEELLRKENGELK
ncbi:hypothetical protein AMELA_G00128980 [Ameiurus melas]|uniref:Uncharacterized protein n=1 Tax=Ameiurus melas TaxID=219545 RepID=A0A7J6AQR5_AMEME|nr:hypothetical protein AMELA_G00128980 [Ameiurus melas]